MPGICDLEEISYLYGVHRKGNLAIEVTATLQLLEASDTANKVYSLVCAKVLNSKNRVEDKVT